MYIMYTHVMLISNGQYLLNLVFSLTKALNGQSLSEAKYIFSPPFNAIWETLLPFILAFLFFTFTFLFQTLNNFN